MATKTEHIGILGLGSRSTQFYLDMLNKKYHEKYGDYHTCPFILYNIDFNSLNNYLPNKFNKLTLALNKHLDALFNLPIKICIIPNITLHEAYDFGGFDYKILHPITLCINYLKKHQIKKITLFGSLYTMQSDYITSKLAAKGIQVFIPIEVHLKELDTLRKKAYNRSETPSDMNRYHDLLNKYSNHSHVLLACTELSILSHQIEKINVIDMATLQIDKALSLIN
ncbi:aspartate/glutamate racemase family protein [Changchengzhania lutea]|uniref:aspartate/glutamate racemase family protein n=1 Tax=Changchengzhania lutea TaxID=2049305 RepID=UPI00115CC5D0|nr:aspartate/glutamate racemase family protein [Changchengzhania lutea]